MQGHSIGPAGGPPSSVSSMTSGGLADAISAAKSISPTSGAQIEAEVNAGTLGVGVGDFGSKALGSHDENTIGLSQSNDSTLNGVALLHEYEHVQNARQAGTPNDQSGGTVPDPCGPIGHAADTATSASQVCDAASDENATDEQREKYCKAYGNLIDAVAAQHAAAKEAGCPIDPPPTSAMACPACS